MVLFDGECIEDCVKANTSNNQRLLAEKTHFSRENYLTENLLKIVLKQKLGTTNAY